MGDAFVVTFVDLKPVEGLLGPFDLSSEAFREYIYPSVGSRYRIENPIGLYRREGGATHRVVDSSGVTHCVPCGPQSPDTVIVWANRDRFVPVNW
jgi:hypothetical protein